jgi:hypothetical protein
VRSGGNKRILRDVQRRVLRVRVTGRRAKVKIRYENGTEKTFRRSLCRWL